MIKKLRKFTNLTIMCLSSNEELKTSIETNLNDCKELIFADNESFETNDKKFDILLVDFCMRGAVDILNQVRVSNPLLPKIVVMDEPTESNIVEAINASTYSILKAPVNFDDLRLSVIMAHNQSKRSDKILLAEGVYYDAYRERFYNKDGYIAFTKLEFNLLKLLLDNHDKIIDYDEIKDKVWQGKKMSIFTMRNVINKIRNKTYYKIIKNNSSKGYQIDTLN